MARIAGIDLPREKRVEIGLTYIYGIGRPSATKICEKANVNPDTRVRELTDDEVKRLSAVIDETMTVEGDRSTWYSFPYKSSIPPDSPHRLQRNTFFFRFRFIFPFSS